MKKQAKLKIPTSTLVKKSALPLPFIEVIVSTWLKDSHGLYDYEAGQSKRQKQVINLVKSSKIYRKLTTLQTQIIDDEDLREMPIQSLYVASVIIDRVSGKYEIQPAEVSGVEQNPILQNEHPEIYQSSYLVVRDYQKNGIQGYPLTPGSFVKFGRVQYIVLQTRSETGVSTFKATSHFQLNTGNYQVQTPLVGTCKICLSQQSTEEDPLISPCLCKGSCEFIHVGCLKQWINSKVKKQYSDIVLTINFSKFQCQICKASFPKTVTLTTGQVIELISFQKPEKPYIILQSINGKQDNKKERNLHMINAVQGLALKVGRGHQCQLRINDISVSRAHAQVFYQEGKFYIRDTKSKFGTLIKLKESINIKEGKKLQFGRVCFQFSLKNQQPKQNQEADTSQQDHGLRI